MKSENENRSPQPEEESDKWGLILLLAFVIGIPILGVLAKLLGY